MDDSREMAKLLAETIKALPGRKVVTLAGDIDDAFVIHDERVSRRNVGEFELLKFAIEAAIVGEGTGMTIRQFLPHLREKRLGNSKIFVPYINLYAVYLGNWRMSIMSSEVVKTCYETDIRTGSSIPKEEGVFYRELSLLEKKKKSGDVLLLKE